MQAITRFNVSNSSKIRSGLIFYTLSAFLFVAVEWIQRLDSFNDESDFFVFILQFGMFWIYLAMVMADNRIHTGRRWRFYNIRHNTLLFLIFNISAYSLNRMIPVFQDSTLWLTIFLVLMNAALLLFVLHRVQMAEWIHHFILPILGASLLLEIYQMFYVLPVYPITAVSFWIFGISLHVFVPLCLVGLIGRILYLYHQQSRDYLFSAMAGIGISLGMTLVFVHKIASVNQIVEQEYQREHAPLSESELPVWVRVSQRIPSNWISERVLKAGITYSQYDAQSFWDFVDVAGGLNEKIEHDPLIFLATVWSGTVQIHHKDRINILKSLYDKRHQAERKLWTGKNLRTSNIVTNVQVFPEYRLAYTEKTIKIKNDLKPVLRWRRTQEALYTFHLPEGAVVTSASLWVEGVEREAWLTTKSKADSAYTTIVGRERRDPLLIHWQEGNRVTARIFPCTPKKPRTFKIGFTTPLKYENNQLTYQNIDFVGPSWEGARETVNLLIEGDDKAFKSSLGFEKEGTSFVYDGGYQSDWNLEMKAPVLAETMFSFNGRTFQLSNAPKNVESFDAAYIYLDINASWDDNEFDQLWPTLKGKNVYVYTNRLEKMSSSNAEDLFELLQKRHYSIFPIHKIDRPVNSLIISKSDRMTPTLSDLKGSTFARELQASLEAQSNPIRLYHLGDIQSPYLQMLCELRALQDESGSLEQLLSWIEQGQFPPKRESQRVVAIDEADMRITEIGMVDTTNRAPDHLMRLFSYNDLMKRIGNGYYNKKQLESGLIERAKEAHILTPISSLLVLETDKDYERFNIKKSQNSLGNAQISSDGAVPEPHEWLLIILSLVFVLYMYWRR